MAHLFKVIVTTNAQRDINVVAETPEEAQGKVVLADGEVVVEIADQGDVTL